MICTRTFKGCRGDRKVRLLFKKGNIGWFNVYLLGPSEVTGCSFRAVTNESNLLSFFKVASLSHTGYKPKGTGEIKNVFFVARYFNWFQFNTDYSKSNVAVIYLNEFASMMFDHTNLQHHLKQTLNCRNWKWKLIICISKAHKLLRETTSFNNTYCV